MQKNWYALYTKPNCEKKIASLLSKWKIENFCPLNSVRATSAWRSKLHSEPLFKSYVFVHILETQIDRLHKVEGVVNFLYWLGAPAIIKKEEIEAIKEFTNDYREIKVERTIVNTADCVQMIDEPLYKMEGKFISIKSKAVKVNLPSLGYTLIAEFGKDRILEKQNSLLKNNLRHQHFNTA
ncbi:MAG: UpxY family transcription antiterminator [Ginsengibacter sp.]